ncbi:RNA polymerase sigma-70 factor (ECF subfamily) [Amycolatopsis echigonensis]|uniref:RNA polymerase sigma-70 factor (ECF subfamily) n=1 Tax=Amycolatopsis echigonensis TaxID=2576905 RepID=A0A2N3WTE9_9PSEU|nr:RNA polymerase sigma-70 factor (ECF subfamily) [Amycolatopsis niigatensis]
MAAVDTGPVTDFERAAAPLRGELLAHSYRLLGSWHEAEDAVQETYLRGWRAWDGFEERSSVRTWLHRIATNVCLNAVRDRGRRALPSGIGAPADDAQPDVLPPETWIEPFPGDRADLRLALIAAMQTLPPAQRAVLLLREVLAFPAAEVAEMMDMSVAAVKSSLQRARARLAEVKSGPEDVVEPSSPQARRLLDAYVTAFESADVSGLTNVLRADATLELLPSRTWFKGMGDCSQVFAAAVGSPGDWRMDRAVVNGQPAAVVRWQGKPFGVAVLDVRRDGIAGVTVFDDPALVERIKVAPSSAWPPASPPPPAPKN